MATPVDCNEIVTQVVTALLKMGLTIPGAHASSGESAAEISAPPVEIDSGGSVSSGGESGFSTSSWADEVEEQAKGTAVPDNAPVIPRVDSGVGIKSFSDVVKKEQVESKGRASVDVVVPAEPSFMKTYVRTANVKNVVKELSAMIGMKLPRAAARDVALCTYTPATVPIAFEGGKARLRGLMTIGDAAMTLGVVQTVVNQGGNAESAQAVRSSVTSNAKLNGLFVNSSLFRFVSFPSGIDPRVSKTSADALEAFIGVLFEYLGMPAVMRFLWAMKIVAPVATVNVSTGSAVLSVGNGFA